MTWAASDLARVTAKMEWGSGNECNNVFQFACIEGGASDSAGQSDLLEIMDDLYTPIADRLQTSLLFTTINVMNVTQERVFGEAPWPVLAAGGYAGSDVPHGACMLVTLRTGYSRHVGRKYLAGGSEGYLTLGVWTSSFIGDVEGAFQTLLSPLEGPISGMHWLPGIVTTNAGFRPFVSLLVSPEPAYQRRRRRGVGA